MNKVLVNRPLLKVTAKQAPEGTGMGRFGGGWEWAFGFRISKNAKREHGHLLLELLTFTIRIDWGKPCP